jgi:hypothetical protein
MNLSVHQDGGCPNIGILETLGREASIAEIKWHALTNKYPETASIVKQAYEILNDIETSVGNTQAEVGESCEWISIVSSVEENRANIRRDLDDKPLFSAIYIMYTLTLNQLKSFLKLRAQAGQSGAMNKTSVESTAQVNDFREVKRGKRHITNDTSQTAKKSTKPVPTTADAKLPPNSVLTSNFVAPLRTTDKAAETTGAENTLLEQEAPRKSGRTPPIVINTQQTSFDTKAT